MKLTPAEIRSQEFPQKMRGYSKLDVDAFLQLVGDAVDALVRKNDEMMDHIEGLELHVKKVSEREALLERSLQAMSDMREEMTDRTDSLLKAAEAESKAKIQHAEEEASRIREEAEWSVRRFRDDIESLENTRQRALMDFVEFLRSQHDLLGSEADRLGIEMIPMSRAEDDKIVSIKKKVEGEEA